MYQIQWQKLAQRQARKIKSQTLRESIFYAVESLQNFPDVQDVKKLTNHEYGFRLRVGNYRVMFDVVDSVRIIEIQEVRKRDERTY